MFKYKQNIRTELNKIHNEISELKDFTKKIENAIPIFNKMYANQKDYNKFINLTNKIIQKIIKHIKLKETKGE